MATPTRRLAALLAGITDNDQATKVTTAGIDDDAVTNAKIGTDAVNADSIAANAVGTSEVADNVLTATDLAANSVGESELSVDYTAQSVPHIIPDVLQPAVDGKLLNGANHSGAYGTAQTQSGGDGHKYYYTNIKGSKPIKDPRIGAHFGSQRHKIKSIQILEQETATHGKNVYSIDGREWMRAVGNFDINYAASGTSVRQQSAAAGSFVEVVGYFLDANLLNESHTADRNLTVQVNGSSAVAFNDFTTTSGNPLENRFVDEMSVVNIDLPTKNSASLGINTLRINTVTGSYPRISGIELIAQDLTGSGSPNRSKIKIHAQNVVSFGKKFPIAETNHHYDPFNGFTNDSTLFSSVVDTATSLGLGTGTTYGAPWDKGSNQHIRPFNGGRVVKWVDSDGTIKTSVTMMPRNAQNIGNNNAQGSAGNASNEITTASATNTHTINFSDDVIDDSLSEVAHSFRAVEFGNGGANGNASFKDFTVLSTSASNSDHSYVMDDGLTSLTGRVRGSGTGFYPDDTDDYWILTFIGTGLGVQGIGGTRVLAQNLPYGTHILKMTRASTTTQSTWVLDGIEIRQAWGNESVNEGHAHTFTFFQPKRPPIPEDCVVIADYMLMADLVKQTAATAGHISKGTRFLSSSRDFLYNAAGSWTGQFNHPAQGTGGMNVNRDANDASAIVKLPFFGTNFISEGYTGRFVSKLNGSALSNVSELTGGWVSKKVGDGTTLGLHEASVNPETNNLLFFASMAIATPIHTSHHYQAFETQFLHELNGGDRNMEQHNLVCSPDGKTWDEITRDTSYLGNVVISASRDGGDKTSNGTYVFDYIRGTSGMRTYFNKKQFAMADYLFICLEDGLYEINLQIRGATANQHLTGQLRINESTQHTIDTVSQSGEKGMLHGGLTLFLKRGDNFDLYRSAGDLEGGTLAESHLIVKRV